jgi:hypothetical protein
LLCGHFIRKAIEERDYDHQQKNARYCLDHAGANEKVAENA